jgi:hypothetical protein
MYAYPVCFTTKIYIPIDLAGYFTRQRNRQLLSFLVATVIAAPGSDDMRRNQLDNPRR